jgi:hypothetical protein
MAAGWMHYCPLRQHAAPVRECLVHGGEGTTDIQMSTCIRPGLLEAADPPPLCTPCRDAQSLRSTQPPSFQRAAALASELALALAAAGHGLAYPYRSMGPSSGRPCL